MGIILGKLAVFFDYGHSFSSIFAYTPFCWLNIDQIYGVPNY